MLVAGFHEEKLLVYNYRNSTYDSCKLKMCPDVDGFSVYKYRKSHFH